MAESVVDEVVSKRMPSSPTPRAQVEESVDASSGSVTVKNGAEDDIVVDGAGRGGRVLSDSTKKLLAKLEAGKNADDPDDDTSPADTGDDVADPDDEGLVAAEGEETAESTDEEETPEEKKAPPANEWQEKASRLEATNRELLAKLESKSKTTSTPNPRVEALLAAEQAYVDEGPIAAVRKFISIVLDSAHDGKDVDTELAGLYTDLTARDLNVPLEQSHLALREASRARLALARDKRERKAQSDTAASKPEQADEQPNEQAVTFIDNQLRTKGEDGTVFADKYPMLMTMAEHLDGASPGKLLAKVIKQEILIGNLDPKLPNDVLIRTAAQRIEDHYTGIANKFPKPKTDITKSGETKPATAKTASKDQRQTTQARTINNASASVAPASSPKTKKAPQVEERPKFKSDKERRDWALRHLD